MNGGGGGPGPQQLLRPQQPHRAAQPQHLGMAAAAPPAGAVGAEAEVELTNLGREEQHSSAVCVALALSIVLVFVLLFNLDAIIEGSSSQLSSSPGSRSTTAAADREGVRAGSFFSSSSSSSSTSFVSRYAPDSPYRYAMGPAATDRADAIAAAAAEAEEEAAAEEEGRTHAGRITPLSSYLLQLESRPTRRPVLLGMDRTRKYSLHFNSEFFFFVFDPTHKQQEQQQNVAAENDAASGGEGKRPVASTPGGTLFPAAADVGTSGAAAADPPNVQRDTAMPPFSPPSFSPAGPLFSPSASPASTSSSASAASSTASASSPSPPPFSAYSFPSSLSTTSGSAAASSTDGSSSSSSFPFSSRALSLVTSGAAGVYLYTTRTIFHSIRLALLRIHLHVSGALAPAAGAPFSLSFLPTPLAAALSPLWRVFIDRDLYLSGLDVRDTHKLHFQGAAPLYKLPVQRGLQLHAAGRGGAAGGGGSAGAGAGTDGSQEDERDAGVPWCTYTATFQLRFEPGLGRSAREADDAAAGEIFYKAIKDGDIMRYAAWAAPSIRQEAAEVEDEEEEAAAAAGYADQRQQLPSWRRRLQAEDAGAADARGKAAADGRTHAPRRKRGAVAGGAVEDAGEMGAARLAGGAAPRRGAQGASGARRNRSSEPKERRSKQRKRRRSKTGDSSSSSRRKRRSRRYSRKTRAGASGVGASSINSDVDNATTGRAITAGAAPSSSFRAASSSPESGSGVFRGSGGAPIPAAVAASSSAKEGGGQRRELATAADEVSEKDGTEGRPVEDGRRRVSLRSAAAASASPAPAAQAEAATVPAAAATPAAAGLVAAGEEIAVGREAGKVSRDGTLSQTGAPSSAAATAAAVRAAVSAAGAAPPVAASAALAAAAAVGAPAATAGTAAATAVAGDSEGETVGEARAEGLEELWTLGEGQHGGNDRAAFPPVPATGQTSAAVAPSRLHSPSAVGDGRAWASRGGSARERPIIEWEGQHIRSQQQEVRSEEEQTQEPESEQQQHPEEEEAEGTRDQQDQGRVAKGQEQKLSEEQQRSRTRSRKRELDGKQQQKSETETAEVETRVLGGEGRRRSSGDGRERTGRAGQQQRNTGRMLLAPVDVLSDVRGAEDYFTWQQQQHLLQGGNEEEERDSDDVAEALFEENEDEERRREIGVEEETGMGAGDSILGSDDLLLNSSSAHGRDSMYGVRRRRGRRRIGGGGLGDREGSMWYGRRRRGDSRSGRLDFFHQDEEDEELPEEEVQEEEEEDADLESASFFAEEGEGEETEEESRGRTGLGTSGRGGAAREAGAGDEEGTRAGGAARKEDMQEGVLSRKYQRLPDVYGELLSSDCGFYIFFKAWEVDYVRLASHITSLTLIFNMKTLVEMRLFWKQMQHTQGTAATATAGGAAAAALLHRVSVLGIAWLAAVDIFEAVAILRVALLLQIMMPYFFILVMFKFVLFGALEVRYLLTVWNAHQQLTHPPESEALGRATTRLYKSFYGSLALLVLFVYHIFPLCPLLCAPLYFFWVPQIVWDVWRGQRNSLDLQFVAGISLCRLVFPAYFFACPASLFVDAFVESHAPSFFALGLITCILLAQVLLMLGQRRFGSRFFVPLEWLPHVYNYHRPLPSFFEEDAEGGLPECAICMNPVDGKSRNRSITPCDHLFHDKCLQQWMEVKMECPNCRGVLPPFP